MSEQPWGRKERVIFPPHQPIYSYGAAMGALIVTGFLLWIHFAALTPLQQAYTPAFVKSGFGSAASKKNGSHELLMVGGGKGPGRPATDADVVEGSTPSFGKHPIPLELSSVAKGAGLDTLYRSQPIRSTDESFHAYLKHVVFRDQGFAVEYSIPMLCGFGIFLAALPFSIQRDIKRRKEMKYGRKLRGPDKLTPAEFTEKLAGTGVGFHISESKTMLRIPRRLEAQHIEIMGDTGTGKSTLINQLLYQIQERDEVAVIHDPAGEFIKKFFNKERGDYVLNPLDDRMPYWGPSEELRTVAEALTLAKSLYQPTDKNRKEFFTEGPQEIFAKMLETGASPHKLAEWMASEDEIDKICAGTHLAKLIPKDSPNQRNGTLGSLGLVAKSFKLLPTKEEAGGRTFVASEWVEKRKGWIFLTSRATERDALRPLQSLWIDWLVLLLLNEPRPDQKPVWFVLDELASLQRLPQLHTAITENRKSKNPLILGFQGKGQMDEVYGNNMAEVMLSQPATKIFLKTSEPKAAQWISDAIGKVEIERVKETHTGGNNAHKNYTLDRQIDPLVMDSEISGLENLHAFLKLGNSVVQFHFDHVSFPENTPKFLPRFVKGDQLSFKGNPQSTNISPEVSQPQPHEPAATKRPTVDYEADQDEADADKKPEPNADDDDGAVEITL